MKILILFLLALIFLVSCRKDKTVEYSGQILLAQSRPEPLAGRQLDFYQPGGNAILMGSSSSSATTTTDASGRFNLTFTPGTGYFAGFRFSSDAPLHIMSDNRFPPFSIDNFHSSNHNPGQPIYIGKIIDTAILKVYFLSNIHPADSIAFLGFTLTGSTQKFYSGISADSSEILTIDTLYGLLITDYDAGSRQFRNYNMQLGTFTRGSAGNIVVNSNPPVAMPEGDEAKREFIYFYRKR